MSSGVRLNLLVVDDHRSAAEAIAILLGREGHSVEVFYDGRSAIERLRSKPTDLVLTDLRMEPVDGLAVVQAARACVPPVDAIVFTAFGSVETAVEAMRLGALDFLTKPVTADQLLRRVRDYRKPQDGWDSIVGESADTRRIRDEVGKVALVRSTVLVQGETGSGRRHIARCLHQRGLDADRPMLVARPLEEIPPALLLSAGTLLVPMVDEWSHEATLDLLRQLAPVEAGQPPRIIATASPNIDLRAARGEIPPELYFRLAVITIRCPPLRDHPDDILPLLEHFLTLHGNSFGKVPPKPTGAQREQLIQHGWPGNVREVANLAERAVVLGHDAFNMPIRPAMSSVLPLSTLSEGFNLTEHLEQIERDLLAKAIEQTGGDRPAVGRLLGLERNTLRYKLNKYNLLDRS